MTRKRLLPAVSLRDLWGMWCLWLVLSALLLAAPAHAKRVALVVGNAAYADKPLRNPVNDAELMQRTLSELGFEVTLLRNASRRDLLAGLRDFEAQAADADVALFYFAGHGTQVAGSNYLIPLQAQIRAESDVPDEAVDAASVLRRLENARAKVGLVVLDACRDNPYAGSTRSSARGLGRMSVPTGSIVAYASAPGSTAEDGSGRNGVYTEQLARQLGTPGLDLREVFDRTAIEVERLTGGKQRPREDIGLRARVVLRPGQGTQVASVVPEPVRPPPVPAPTRFPVPAPAPVVQRQPYEPDMALLPAGSFLMGSSAAEPGRDSDEGPQRRVSVKAFELGKTEVTQGQWKAVMGGNPSHFSQCGDNCPVENVSWDDVQAYIRKLNQMTGKAYRLPSEAEWEYGARAGCESAFNVGGQCAHKIEASEANFEGNYTYNGSAQGAYRQKTTAVGSFPANNWGLSDMHGNVWEWVQDCFEQDYSKGQPTDGRSHRGGDNSCSRRVLRGGSWSSNPQNLRSGFRFRNTPANRSNFIGFRLARTVP